MYAAMPITIKARTSRKDVCCLVSCVRESRIILASIIA
jgi:hypothetical protein